MPCSYHGKCSKTSWLPASDELTPRWCAYGLDVIVLQLHSLCCQSVQGRCVDVGVMIADVIKALIISHNKDDVRARMVRLLDLIRARPVPGQITQTEQTDNGEPSESRYCHGND